MPVKTALGVNIFDSFFILLHSVSGFNMALTEKWLSTLLAVQGSYPSSSDLYSRILEQFQKSPRMP